MKTFFYPRLALDGLRKNKRMVFPYILTCICMICMFYILMFLSSDKTTSLLPRGASTTSLIMVLGAVVIGIFSLIFLYYTNSFLIRKRAGEFGLYNVLGMNKGNLCRIITFETLITSGVSLVLGLLAGIILSKLAELCLVKMMGGTVTYNLRVDTFYVIVTLFFYLVIFALIWLSSVIKVRRSSAVSLLKSEKAGEKPPKANWFLGLLGAVILTVAYYIAITIDNPIQAILWFFLAVVLVIIATYLLMIAGSVLLCRILQKNKKYYYDPAHFVSVSSMAYRMKRNGAGLASIAIIATMVLVMLSSVSCLWFGSKDMLATRFPGDIDYTVRFNEGKLLNETNMDAIKTLIKDYGEEHDLGIEPVLDIYYAEISGMGEENRICFDEYAEEDLSTVSKIREVFLIPVSEYNKKTGNDITLQPGEALAFGSKCNVDQDTLELVLGNRIMILQLLKTDAKAFKIENSLKDIVPEIVLVVSDPVEISEGLGLASDDKYGPMRYMWKYCFNVDQTSMSMMDCANAIRSSVNDSLESDPHMSGNYMLYSEERETEGVELVSANGSMFFIGIVLSAVFILAAVLIIYYKQISEGYEDSKRFEVMRKVGMTGKEIKKSINSQLLVVFFIPLFFAGLHLAFAFPMIKKLLILFGIYTTGLFVITTVISFGIFAVFYIAVYKMTSNVYYNIVSGVK
ncbi:MAG: ABC transporter permease [Lachnospiraceae bacterium]|nr:ABC transporter permease [Lachnospiraceae bacterium]